MIINFADLAELKIIKEDKNYTIGNLGNAKSIDEALTALKHTSFCSDSSITLLLDFVKFTLPNTIQITNLFGSQLNIKGTKQSFNLSASGITKSGAILTLNSIEKIPLNIVGLGLIIRGNAVKNRGVWIITERTSDYRLKVQATVNQVDSLLAGTFDICTTLEINNNHALLVYGKDLGLLDDIVIKQSGTLGGAKKAGVFCSNGKINIGNNVGITGFNYGYYSELDGFISAEKSAACLNADYGYYASFSGVIDADDSLVNENGLDYFGELGGNVVPYTSADFHTHLNKTILDGIQEALTTALKNAYDAAVSDSHTHTNKTILDNIEEALTTALKNAYDGAVSQSHAHSNILILDNIEEALTTALKNSYDSAASQMHTHANITVLNNVEEALTTALKSAYDGAVSTAHSHSNMTVLSGTEESFTTLIKNNIGKDITVTIDNGASYIISGFKGFIIVPRSYNITAWTISANEIGNIAIDVWKCPFAGIPPTIANTIVNGHYIGLATEQGAKNEAISDWTETAVNEWDAIGFNVNVSPAPTVKKITLVLKGS